MSITNFISLFGGLALFLYGMKMLGDGLEKYAGQRMQKIVETLTSNLLKGVLVGTLVTALIQSSSATTVMVVGFVNAGIMTLKQSVGVIMGANIGTTVTSMIIAMDALNKEAWYLSIFTPTMLTPIALFIGMLLVIVSKNSRKNIVGEIFLGFGILFTGMKGMESALASLQDLPQFQEMFATCANPFVGVLLGMLVTALIQSSSASVGILQAASVSGAIYFSSAIPIILGTNIGTCITAILSSIGANKTAKRAAFIHLYFNLIGTVVFLIIIYTVNHFSQWWFWNEAITKPGIAMFHFIFNIISTALLLPFSNLLVKLANMSIRDRKEPAAEGAPSAYPTYIDERLLSTPPIAVAQTVKGVVNMGRLAQDNYKLAINSIIESNYNRLDEVNHNENKIDEMEGIFTNFLVKIAEKPVNEKENLVVSNLFHTINDIERIGDHAKNLSDLCEEMQKKKIEFSKGARKELNTISKAVYDIIECALIAFENNDMEYAYRVEPLEHVIDTMEEKLKKRHVDRLTKQKCDIKSSIIFLEIIENLERISDHCSNIGISVLQNNTKDESFDPHAYTRDIRYTMNDKQRQVMKDFEEKYALKKS